MKHSSLQRVFIFPFILLLLCLAMTMGGILYQAGEDATDALSRKALVDSISRIEQATERLLLSAQTTLKSVAPDPVVVDKGATPVVMPFPENAADIEFRLWIASDLYGDVNRYVYFGGADGSFVGVNRSNPGVIDVRLKDAANPLRSVYKVNGPGRREALLRTEKYDPRTRPWYIRAVERRKPTWSALYTDFSTREPLLTLAKPVFRADRSLAGTVATDLSLQALTGFLQGLTVSKNGVAFIVERSGALIGTSAAEMPYRLEQSSLTRLSASESSNRLVRAAYKDVSAALAANAMPGRVLMREIEIEQGRAEIAATLLRDDAGLDWVIVVAAPRADFMGSLTQGIYKSLGIGLVAMFVVLVLGFVGLRWTLRDIRKLTQAVGDLGSGKPFSALDIDRGDEIGQLAHSFEQMERNLRMDRLTNILNRESLIAQIEFRMHGAGNANSLRFALLFIDLDGFKAINDVHGHDNGDRVLTEVAHRLQGALRREDAVGRFGGDEFVVYLHGVDSNTLVHSLSDKIRNILEHPVALSEGAIGRVGASVGAARYPTDGADVETLIKVADMRMLAMKRERKTA
jgi:diguanylate cyclase